MNSTLRFGVTLSPETWDEATDGVVFQIQIRNGNSTQMIYYRYINPAQNAADKKLDQNDISLSQFGGQNVSFCFLTNAGLAKDITFDRAYWWNPQLLREHGDAS